MDTSKEYIKMIENKVKADLEAIENGGIII